MERSLPLIPAAIHWQQKTSFITNAFFAICLTFTPHVFAISNAQHIEIEFLLDDLIEEVAVDTSNQTIEEQTLLQVAPTERLTTQNNNLWLRIQNGYAMPNISSPYTAKYENLYASKPNYVAQMMSRTEKYLFYVVEEVAKRGMPMEVALLPMIESAYNPKAISRSKAMGIWQFMPATGRHFGLKQNWWADHRRDVAASTNAALNYLEKLHGMFGSWDLALAAYNAGEGTVGRAIKKNQRLGLPTDYQSLKLPLETTHYVPKLQAIKNIMTNPGQYGLNISPIANQAYFAEIDAPYQIDAKLAANLAGISQKEFALLNPRYNRPIIASRNNTHKLLLPVASIESFETNLKNHNKSLISWKVYRAKSGEYISKIAKKFNINTRQLRKVNGLSKNKKLPNAFHLLVPAGDKATSSINVARLEKQKIKNQRKSKSQITHKIKRGETLGALAKRYGTNTRALMKMNRLQSTKLKIGQTIQINGRRKSARHVTHRIKRGETLGALAKRYGTNTRALMKMNRLKSTKLKVGQIIQVKGKRKRAKTKRI